MENKISFDYAVIFASDDIKRDFMECIATVISECDESIMLVKDENGCIEKIADITTSRPDYGKFKYNICLNYGVADTYGVNAKEVEPIVNMAQMLINPSKDIYMGVAIKMAKIIAENFNISPKKQVKQ